MVQQKSFKSWLQNEAAINHQRPNGVQRGGIGISSMSYMDRVRRGKGVEERIKEILRSMGMNITDPTSEEDMHQKIDGFIDGKPIQIKYRDSGDDILYELVKPHDPRFTLQQNIKANPGRDLRGKAVSYIVLSRDGSKIYIIPVTHIKTILSQAAREYSNQPLTRAFRSSMGIEFRPLSDPSDGRLKINAFIPPRVFGSIAQIINVPKAA